MTAPLTQVGVNSGFATSRTPDAVFDTPNDVGQFSYTYSFDLIENKSKQVKTTLHPLADTVPTLSHDTTRTVKRQLSLALDVDDTALIDPIGDRILPYLVLADGTRFPLGKYMFTDFSRAVFTNGKRSAPTLADEMFILDQQRDTGFPTRIPLGLTAYSTFNNTIALLRQLMADYPSISYNFDDTTYSQVSGWSLGTSGAQILSDIALYGDYFLPWFNNAGVLRMIRTFDPGVGVPTFDWDRYYHVLSNSVTETDDLLTAANRFVVVSNSVSTTTQSAPLIGRYDIPITAPHSVQNRGFVVPDIRQIQVSDQRQAEAMAANIGITSTVFERQAVSTIPDPRHDSYDVIRWQGDNWLELAWTLNMIAGGTMDHLIRKVY